MNIQVLHLPHGGQREVASLVGLPFHQLLQECRAHLAAADNAHRDICLLQQESIVGGFQGQRELIPANNCRDVPLGGTLGNRNDVHLRLAEAVEEAARDAGVILHPLADHCEDAQVLFEGGPRLLIPRDLQLERTLNSVQGHLPVSLCHGDRDGVLRGPLGGEDHVHPHAGQGIHKALRHTVRAHEGSPSNCDETDLVDGGDCLDWHVHVDFIVLVLPAKICVPASVHTRARVRRFKHVLHQYWDAVLDAWHHC
mmetsp:Transcript_850/g.1951  ORF Transcript_850/g.1951 Transcript_850/m.1951 type:complete len:254 (-) Transcript_850:1240-2001(-)